MEKAIFIYNPLSGGQRAPLELDYILGRFQDKNILIQPYRICNTKQDNLLNTLKENNYSFAVLSGGDGTLNTITNLILKNGLNLPIGIIPSGTCNDFARSLNIPHHVNDCLDIILSGKTTDVDVGLINGEHYFLGTCAGGSFVNVSFSTHGELKKNFGPFAYYLKGLSEVRNIRAFKIKVTTDQQTIEDKVILFLVLNGKSAAGFKNIINEADISDGFMDIVLIKKCSHIDLAALFFNALSNDSLNNKNVTVLKSSSCKIECTPSISVSIDGEKGSGVIPLNIQFVHNALKVFVK